MWVVRRLPKGEKVEAVIAKYPVRQAAKWNGTLPALDEVKSFFPGAEKSGTNLIIEVGGLEVVIASGQNVVGGDNNYLWLGGDDEYAAQWEVQPL